MEIVLMVLTGMAVVVAVSFAFVILKVVVPALMLGVVALVCYAAYRAVRYFIDLFRPSSEMIGGV